MRIGLIAVDGHGGFPNQGLDVRFITPDTARLLAKLHWIRFIRFACDTSEILPVIQQATGEQQRFARWVNQKVLFKSCSWEDFRKDRQEAAPILKMRQIKKGAGLFG